jgi:hypothetical protein
VRMSADRRCLAGEKKSGRQDSTDQSSECCKDRSH